MEQIVYQDSFGLMGTNYHQTQAKLIAMRLSKKEPYLGKNKQEIEDWIRSHSRVLYKYYDLTTDDVRLVKEPKNKHDKYAIKVLVKGLFAGYIPADIARKIHPIVNEFGYKYTARLDGRGGPYKTLSNDFKKVVNGSKDVTFYLQLTIIKKAPLSIRILKKIFSRKK